MRVGVPRETRANETRVACTPDVAKKLIKKGFEVLVESGAGAKAGFPDELYVKEGCKTGSSADALASDIVFKIHKPTSEEIGKFRQGSVLICFTEPYNKDGTAEKLAQAGVELMSVELIPRTSRAQSMDVLSSQANIAGYRAVLEAAVNYVRFFPMMMTSAGLAKPAKCIVLGAGVAGLQAIATAKRLGCSVEAFDVRAEVKEQILSLGAKFIDIDLGEEGSGAGGYAKELSEAGKQRQQAALTERIKKADIVISTANIPGRKAPVLVTEDAVKGMRAGSVIVDMAAANGGNCPLTEAEKTVEKFGVKLIGVTNFPALVPSDSSQFYGQNLFNLLALVIEEKDKKPNLKMNLEDDIVAACLVTSQGQVRK